MSKTEIKISIKEVVLAVAEAVSNGVNRLHYHINRVLNNVSGRLDDCINASIESIGDSLIAQASAETTKPFDKDNKVAARIDRLNGAMDALFSAHLKACAKLNERRAAYLTDEELAKACDKSAALLAKRRELLNRKRYF